MCRSKHVEPSINFGIINSITRCILLAFLLSFFPTDFRKNTAISNFVKIRAIGAEWLHADGRADGRTETDIAKLTASFPNFDDAPEKCNVQWLMLYLVERLVTECGSLQNTHKLVAECAHIQHRLCIRYQKTYVSCSIHILHYNVITSVSQRCFMVICIFSCFTSLAAALL